MGPPVPPPEEGASAPSFVDPSIPTEVLAPSATPRMREAPILSGEPVPLGRGPFAIVEALLKSPARVLYELQHGRGALFKLAALVIVSMAITGLVIAAFSGGLQFLWVPLKLTAGIFFCALICFPSLYIFSALAGGEQSLRDTWGAMSMGIALIGVLLVGFAPITWVFSQATTSVAFMGAIHLIVLLISTGFGLALIRRAIAAVNGRPVRGNVLWSLVFILVVLQMTTTLRPLVGEYDGTLLHEKQFFLTHWLESLR